MKPVLARRLWHSLEAINAVTYFTGECREAPDGSSPPMLQSGSHVALLTGTGLDGCEPHVLFAACEGAPVELYQQSRGWSPDDWQQAIESLAGRGLLTGEGSGVSRWCPRRGPGG